jgi:hypothetical protein
LNIFIAKETTGDSKVKIKLNEYIQLYNGYYNTLLKRGCPFRNGVETDVPFKNVL